MPHVSQLGSGRRIELNIEFKDLTTFSQDHESRSGFVHPAFRGRDAAKRCGNLAIDLRLGKSESPSWRADLKNTAKCSPNICL